MPPVRVTVRLPAALRALFPGAPERAEVEAATVDAAIGALDCRWPGMRDRLCDSTPAIRRHINIFVAGEKAMLETPLSPGTEVIVLLAMRGG